MIGAYAQTELGHGSNVRGIETIAVYDKNTEEFVVHSPTLSSSKWWPGALGTSATHAAVMARCGWAMVGPYTYILWSTVQLHINVMLIHKLYYHTFVRIHTHT